MYIGRTEQHTLNSKKRLNILVIQRSRAEVHNSGEQRMQRFLWKTLEARLYVACTQPPAIKYSRLERMPDPRPRQLTNIKTHLYDLHNLNAEILCKYPVSKHFAPSLFSTIIFFAQMSEMKQINHD